MNGQAAGAGTDCSATVHRKRGKFAETAASADKLPPRPL
jgi:hypothetical protein